MVYSLHELIKVVGQETKDFLYSKLKGKYL